MSTSSLLDSRTRVARALRGEILDRVAIGEIEFDDARVREALGLDQAAAIAPAARQAVLQRLGHDLITVPVPGAENDWETALFTLNYWRQESQFFVFASIAGLLSDLHKVWKPKQPRIGRSELAQVESLMADALLERQEIVLQVARAGAEGLIIREELVQAAGLILPLPVLQQIYFPYLTVLIHAAHHAGLPVVLSSPGNISASLADLAASGLNGIQGLEPTTGLTPAHLVEHSGGLLCPWGGFDPAWLALSSHADPQTKAADMAHLAAAWRRNLNGAPAIFGFTHGIPATIALQDLEMLYQTVKSAA